MKVAKINVNDVKSFVIILKGFCSEGIGFEEHTLIVCKEVGKAAEAVMEIHNTKYNKYEHKDLVLNDKLINLLTNENILDIYHHDEIEPEEELCQLDGYDYEMEIKINGKGKHYEFAGCDSVAFPLTKALTEYYESLMEKGYEEER